jgi:WD40 repeat protein
MGAAGAGSARIAALAEGVLKAMLLKSQKIAAVVLLTFVLFVAAVVLVQAERGTRDARAKVLQLGERGRRVVWNPDGQTLVVVTKVEKTFLGFKYDSHGSAIRLWDVETGQMRQTLAESAEKGLAFQQVVFSADGKTIAATVTVEVNIPNGREIRDVIKVWDARTLSLKQTLDGESHIAGLALSPDGKLVATGNSRQKTVKLWDSGTGKLERTLQTGVAPPWSLVFSPDGKNLGVGCQQADHSGQVQIWDARTWNLKHQLKQEKYVNAVAFSANGKLLASGSGGSLVQLWDTETGKLIHSLEGVGHGTRTVAFSPDGRTIGAGCKDGKVLLWDVRTGEQKETLQGHAAEVYSIAFSPDGKTLASTSQDETVRLWAMDERAAREDE